MRAKSIFTVMLGGLLLGYVSQAQEHVTGVGVALGVETNAVKIMKVFPNTPASKAGLSRGLMVQKIDGTATDGRHLKDWVEKLRGAVGTKVKLELVDPAKGMTNTVELTRERIVWCRADALKGGVK
jgi:carboxyl-terminal processing protease